MIVCSPSNRQALRTRVSAFAPQTHTPKAAKAQKNKEHSLRTRVSAFAPQTHTPKAERSKE